MRRRRRCAAGRSPRRKELESCLLGGRQRLACFRGLDREAVLLAHELGHAPRFVRLGDMSGYDLDRLAAELKGRLAVGEQVLGPVTLQSLTRADEEAPAVGGDPD